MPTLQSLLEDNWPLDEDHLGVLRMRILQARTILGRISREAGSCTKKYELQDYVTSADTLDLFHTEWAPPAITSQAAQHYAGFNAIIHEANELPLHEGRLWWRKEVRFSPENTQLAGRKLAAWAAQALAWLDDITL